MRLTKERLATVCFWLAVVVMLIVGRYTYQDYGLTVDENVERESAFMSYQHAAELLFDKEISVFDQDLSEYADRYYGVALQLPMVAVEHLTGFTMPLRDAFLLRHLYTFLVCMTGWVCFYFFCKKVFRDGWLALLGMLMCQRLCVCPVCKHTLHRFYVSRSAVRVPRAARCTAGQAGKDTAASVAAEEFAAVLHQYRVGFWVLYHRFACGME